MAASSNLTLNTLLNISYGTFTRGTEMQREVQQYVSKGASKGMKEGAKKGGEELAKWAKIAADLKRAGLKKEKEDFDKKIKEQLRLEKDLARRARLLSQEIKKKEEGAAKEALKKEKNELLYRISMEKKARTKMEDAADRRAKDRLKLIEDYEEKINQSRTESMKEAGEGLQNAIKTAFSADSLDLENITQGLTGGLADMLGGMAGKMGAAGGAGAPAFAALAESAALLGAAVGPLAALAAVIGMAYNQTKEMNKELMESSSVFDLVGSNSQKIKAMGVEFSSLQVRLATMRTTIQDIAYDMRLSGDEVMAATKALSEAGITFREFEEISRDATNSFEGFQDVLRSSLSAAYGLGLEVSDVAEYYNKMSRDLGYNLDQIEGSFGLIAEQAQLAGMRTKDFFGSVTEASSGMALYNFRVGDTATLLTELVKILGEDMAKSKLGLEGTFKGMGMQEKYKQVLLGGSKFTGAVKADMRAQAKVFAESLEKTPGAEGLKKSRIMGEGGAIDTKKLASLSGKAFREALETSGLSDTQKRQLQTLRKLSKAEKGSMGVAEATGALSKRGELAAQMAQGSAMFGGRLLSELSGVERMMAEEVTQRSGEDYDLLARMQESMMAQYEQMKASQDPKIMGKTFEEAVTEGLLNASEEDVNKAVNKKHFSEVEKAARDQLKETRSISQTVTNVIQQLLGRIALGVELLTNLFGEDSTKDEEASRSIARQEEFVKSIDSLDTTISEKKSAMEESADPAERAKLKAEIDAAVSERASKSKALRDEEVIQRAITRGESVNAVRGSLFKEQYGDQLSSLTPEKLKAAGLYQLVKTDPGSVGEQVEGAGGSSSYEGGAAKPVEIVDLTNLTEDQKLKVEQLLAQDKQAAIDQQMRDEAAGDQSEEENKKLIETLQKMSTVEAIQQLTSYLELSDEQVKAAMMGNADVLGSIQDKLKEGGLTETEALLFARTGWKGGFKQEDITGGSGGSGGGGSAGGTSGGGGEPEEELTYDDMGHALINGVHEHDWEKEAHVEDFIYRGDGTRGKITPIDTADQFYGAKPGGAIDKALQAASGGGGGRSVIININGGDEGRIYSVVKKVLVETGYSGMKSY